MTDFRMFFPAIRSSMAFAVTVMILTITTGLADVDADPAIDLIAGWDQDRIATIFQHEDASDRAAELSRLIYRVARHPASRYEQLASNHVASDVTVRQIGDAIVFDGVVGSISRVAVPDALVEFVEFEWIHVLEAMATESQMPAQDQAATKRKLPTKIWMAGIPRGLKVGDRLTAAGIQISSPGQPTMIAAASMEWFPASPPHPGLETLVDAGFDLNLVDRIKRRQREPLEAEDGDAFYGMLALSPFSSNSAKNVSPIKLLTDPDRLTGTMVRIRLDVVQCTRIAVTSPDRQRQIASDHYYQLDGFVELGDREVVIRSSDGRGEPITFGGRYPVSLVSRTVPDSLAPAAINPATRSRLVDVDGMFFRLWSYQSDLMRNTNLDQFGPLIMASRFDLVELTGADSVGVNRIGVAAATALVLGVIAVTLWHVVTSRQDRAIRRRRGET